MDKTFFILIFFQKFIFPKSGIQIYLKFSSTFYILVQNQNFGKKLKFWSKIKILVKNQNFGQNSKFGQKSNFFDKKN